MPESQTATMVFMVPTSVKCPKCNFSMHAKNHSQVDTFCPKCYGDFLHQHIPVMVPDPNGKPFDPNGQAVNF